MASERTSGRQRFPVSDHCDGRRFFNPRYHVNASFWDILRWKRTSKPAVWPRRVEYPCLPLPNPGPEGEITATWINHSTFLLRGPFGSILTDPVFSENVGLFGRIGPRRVHAPGIPFEELPRIDMILLSHDHYDHCDLPSLARLARKHDPLLITPLGNAGLARRAGIRRVRELDWWQSEVLPEGTEVTVTPARHWSNRLTGKRNGRLWGGFSIRARGRRIHFTGDTGADDHMFSEIHARLGPADLAMIPIGAYEPRWFMAPQHCSPEEAVRIHRQLGSRLSVGMHWGCWQLTDEGHEDPPKELSQVLVKEAIDRETFRVVRPGESIVL